MPQQSRSLSRIFLDSVLWVGGIAVFGIAPLLFLWFISFLSTEQIADKEIEALYEVKAVLFMCCTLTGTVLMNFFRSGIKVKGWLQFFAVYVFPFVLLGYLFLKYLQVYVQFNDIHDFGPGKVTTLLVIVFTFIYAVGVRMIYLRLR